MPTTQQDAARVLVKLTAPGLPRLTWHLPGHGDGWKAQPPAIDSSDAKTAAMEAWAAHLGVESEVKRYGDYTEMQIRAEVDGVPVDILTHFTKAAAYGLAGGAR